MEFLQQWLDNTSYPIFTAFILGLMTAISPCPLATNITAIGYISKDIEDKRKVFLNGILYTVGRAFTYTGLGLLFYFGANQFQIAGFFNKYGERFLGPLLIIIGLVMLNVIRVKLPGTGILGEKVVAKNRMGSSLSSFLLGVVFSLAFCPYSGVLYFGMLIPITVSSASGLYLPLVFALGTGLPVIIFAWFIAFTISGIASLYNKIKLFELWFRRGISVLFIITGLYYSYLFYFQKLFE